MAVDAMTIHVFQKVDRQGSYLKLNTTCVKDGHFMTLGEFRCRTGALEIADDLSDLAAMILTALYGLDYDL